MKYPDGHVKTPLEPIMQEGSTGGSSEYQESTLPGRLPLSLESKVVRVPLSVGNRVVSSALDCLLSSFEFLRSRCALIIGASFLFLPFFTAKCHLHARFPPLKLSSFPKGASVRFLESISESGCVCIWTSTHASGSLVRLGIFHSGC